MQKTSAIQKKTVILSSVIIRFFSCFCDDYTNTKNTLIKPAFSIAKVKGHHLFNSRPYINDVNVSEQLYKEIKKNKLNLGISFQTIRCF